MASSALLASTVSKPAFWKTVAALMAIRNSSSTMRTVGRLAVGTRDAFLVMRFLAPVQPNSSERGIVPCSPSIHLLAILVFDLKKPGEAVLCELMVNRSFPWQQTVCAGEPHW